MKPTVYLDSSVPSYWLEQGDDPIVHARHLITRAWWANGLPHFEAYVSQVVLDELAGGEPERAARRLKLVSDYRKLQITEPVAQAARFYADNFAMPRNNLRDALHLALASVHGIDYLVTWNLAHLANARKRTHIEALNHMLRLMSPVICTPPELMADTQETAER